MAYAAKQDSAKRTMFRARGLIVESFMYRPEVTVHPNDENSERKGYLAEFNPLILFRTVSIDNRAEKNIFKVNQRNHYRVLKALNTAFSWFFDEKLKNLFYENEDGQLCYNNEYNYLEVNLKDGATTIQRLKIIPSVVVDKDDRDCEGILMYINSSSSVARLTITQFQDLFGIIKNFSFQNEISILYNLMNEMRDHGGWILNTQGYGMNIDNSKLFKSLVNATPGKEVSTHTPEELLSSLNKGDEFKFAIENDVVGEMKEV